MVGGAVGVFVGSAAPVRGREELVELVSCEEGVEKEEEEDKDDEVVSDKVLDGLSTDSVPHQSFV